MSSLRPSLPVRRQHGVALVEALVAILLLGIGLVGAVAMQARSYQALADAGSRAEATIAIERLVGTMSTDQANLASYAMAADAEEAPERLAAWYADTQSAIPGAAVEVAVDSVASTTRTVVTVTIAWRRQGVRSPASVSCPTSGALPAACDRQAETIYLSQSV